MLAGCSVPVASVTIVLPVTIVNEPMLGGLYVLVGGRAAGKSTLLPHLVRLARGPIVLEMDELLDDGSLLGVQVGGPEGTTAWAAYDRMWGRFLAMARRARHPVLLLCPTPPAEALGRSGGVFDPPQLGAVGLLGSSAARTPSRAWLEPGTSRRVHG